ncbi:FtsW/RodA/SpoVE family cell cycle protein [Oscillibacter sp.]|uniref:FtsW/RodA/SpoVE family cell cycle protein n=1 Tax=Oscillibacter sp. TaxID=1945593 RepID=UPI002607205F|nr:FtsW/RodA/SpoVE family cell cycle protein [Oscillibacter sp.]MDD3346860.1 FtsW/RodA/SpoVE family cell cycle protein [Oscillibacter sp.]
MEALMAPLQALLDRISALLTAYPLIGEWYMAFVRFLFPVLAVLILFRAVRSLLRIPHTPEIWGQLSLPNGTPLQLTHWENIIGRGKNADVYLNYPSISRQHAALCRGENENWTLYDLGSKGGTAVNGEPVATSVPVKLGDTIALGGVPLVFLPQTVAEREELEEKRRSERPASIWPSFLWLTLFQVLTCLQLIVSMGERSTAAVPLAFFSLSAVMWAYYAVLRCSRCVGFELETIAFFLSTLSLSVTASSAPESLFKQLLAIFLGLILFLVLGLFLRDLSRVQKNRWLMAAGAIGLLGITLVLGHAKYGAVNWISLGGLSFQPSEIAKICYIFAGSATLERLFHRRNLTLFIVLTGVCIGLLGLMSDFGTAAIFFVTFLVIAYLRSGDWATLSLICGAAVFGAGIILKFKPYILNRFASWGHAWEAASTTGYQQTRTMSAAASGGLLGMGSGNGWLHKIAAADTDLVFGMLCEEWGLLIALLAAASIIVLAFFAARAVRVGRSSFYTIAACAAGSLLVFQTCLNVFGSVDLLPLTGVTFPFVSNGGSAMMSAWGLLAFLKATDTRENASFAIRRRGQKRLTEEARKRVDTVGDPFGTGEAANEKN